MSSIDLSPEALTRLKTLAKKATPGPWINKVRSKGSVDDGATFITTESRESDALFEIARLDFINVYAGRKLSKFSREQRANASYIAAAHPGVVLAMCEEIERLRAEVGRLDHEADWLALKASNKSCPSHLWALSRDSCGSVGIPPDCATCWREAARKAVEGAA